MTKIDLTDDAAVVDYVSDKIDVAGEQPERRALEREWSANNSYFVGQQFFVSGSNGLRFPKKLNPEIYTANLVMPKVMEAVARMLAINPDFQVVPDGTDFLSRNAAKLGTEVYSHLKTVTNWRMQRMLMLLSSAIFGSAFVKTTWDPVAGKMRRVYHRSKTDDTPNIEVLNDPEQRRKLELEGAYTDVFGGEIELKIPTPYQVHWDPNCRTDWPDAMWGGQVTYPYTQSIKDTYRDELIERHGSLGPSMIHSTADDTSAEFLEKQISFMAQRMDGGYRVTAEPRGLLGKRTRQIEYFERPSRSNDNKGIYALIAGDKVIRAGFNPYVAAGMPIPFVKMDFIPFIGRFIGTSLVGQMRGPQRAYNEARMAVRRFAKNNGHAPIFLPKGNGLKPMNLRGFAGVVYEINMNLSPPVFGQTPRLPDSIVTDQETAKREMDEIAANAASPNNVPGSVRSGSGISQVRSENRGLIQPTAEAMLSASTTIGVNFLKLVGLYYDDNRVMQITAADGQVEVRAFKGADLRGQHVLRVRQSEGPIESTEQHKATILEMMQLQVLKPEDPKDRLLIANALNFRDVDPALKAVLRQVADEERILYQMMTDESYLPPGVFPWNDYSARAEVLEQEMNTEAFELMDPNTQSKLVSRWQELKQALQQQIEGQIAAQQALAGTPGESGQPSAPKPRQSAGAQGA